MRGITKFAPFWLLSALLISGCPGDRPPGSLSSAPDSGPDSFVSPWPDVGHPDAGPDYKSNFPRPTADASPKADGRTSSRRPLFPATAPFYRDYSKAKVATNSKNVITWLNNQGGGFGLGRLQLDASLGINYATTGTPNETFTKAKSYFYSPDCDYVKVPLPFGGSLEGESGYQCYGGGDCHLIVIDRRPGVDRLFEMRKANVDTGGVLHGGCLAAWDLSRDYWTKNPALGRGEQCTSADAAGFPIAPLLITVDELRNGVIPHSLRLALPNSRIRPMIVHPATHGTKVASGGPDAPPYGTLFRLKASFNISGLSRNAQIVAVALKRHGMFLVDGGKVALPTVEKGVLAARLLDPHDLRSIKITDFEVIDPGSAPRAVTYSCVRTPY